MIETRCKICMNRAARDLVDGAALAGDKPVDIFKRYGEAMHLSQSSIYRHVRGHLPTNAITPAWIDGTTTVGDVVSDLAALRTSLIEQRANALERGQLTIANATALRIEQTSIALLREAHVSDESAARDSQTAQYLLGGLFTAARTRPELARELAAGVRAYRNDDDAHALAAELDGLADTNETNNKEI